MTTPPPIDRSRLAVFLSGSGRTLVNLHERIEAGTLDATIVDVVASRSCKGIDRAQELGYDPEIFPGEFTAEQLLDRVERFRAGLIVLAGYLRRVPVPTPLVRRIVNIHPALLPGDGTGGRFGGPGLYGERVHKAVLDAGVTESGCTVHYCDAEYDAGPVILRRTCPVLPTDTPETLAARVFGSNSRPTPPGCNSRSPNRVHPCRVGTATGHPLVSGMHNRGPSVHRTRFLRSATRAMTAYACTAVLLLGSGATAQSQGTDPLDILDEEIEAAADEMRAQRAAGQGPPNSPARRSKRSARATSSRPSGCC